MGSQSSASSASSFSTPSSLSSEAFGPPIEGKSYYQLFYRCDIYGYYEEERASDIYVDADLIAELPAYIVHLHSVNTEAFIIPAGQPTYTAAQVVARGGTSLYLGWPWVLEWHSPPDNDLSDCLGPSFDPSTWPSTLTCTTPAYSWMSWPVYRSYSDYTSSDGRTVLGVQWGSCCVWYLIIYDEEGRIMWKGYKGGGILPIGRYYFEEGRTTGFPFLDIVTP